MPDAPAPERRRRWPWFVAAGLLVAAIGFAMLLPRSEPTGSAEDGAAPPAGAALSTAPPAGYVGGAACAECHAKEHAAWQGSHHDRAMAEASEATVLADFNGTRFRHRGVTSTFFRRDGKYFVQTDGPDGKLADFEVRYTFGFTPLQQYLIELPGGRLQALGIAWDSRPAAQGGQRWFHLYGDRNLKPGDALHWTGIDQTWNYQCADCHSTNLRKNYDPASNRYATTWTDINVTCEACHGPGSRHVKWARTAGGPPSSAKGKGLTVEFDERRGVHWTFDAATGAPLRSAPRATSREIDTCARCHARRGQFSDAWQAGDRVADGFRLARIEPGLYHADGQQRDEVYIYGSFVASRMHAKGVTCSDCHEPHSGRLRAPGNAVCGQCHVPGRYDAPSHHRHKAGSKGAECAACHMPTTTYMGVDPRHDHGFRIPRPDRTLALGIPNACNQCHADRKPEWAVAAIGRWTGTPKPGYQTFAEAFAAADRGAAGARQALAAVANDAALPGFVRASAIARAGRDPGPSLRLAVQSALADPDAEVRAAAVAALSDADPGTRARLLPALLNDPVRRVRMDAARELAGEPEATLAPEQRTAFGAALDEYVAAERFNADRPESRANLGHLHDLQGRPAEAVAAYRSALQLDPAFTPAAINLADVERRLGNEVEAEATLREALRRDPRSAAAQFALGLSLTRQRRSAEALKALAEAARLAPDSARYLYVYVVALHSAGERGRARRELELGLTRHPNDRDLLLTLALFERDAGRSERALVHARRLAELEPENSDAARLVRQLVGR